MATPGETVLDGEQYRPKRIRSCVDNNDETITETELKSNTEPGFISLLERFKLNPFIRLLLR